MSAKEKSKHGKSKRGKGKKKKGREKLVVCAACGRRIPRDRAIYVNRRQVYSTDTKKDDEVKTFSIIRLPYCISCAKHRGIFEKKKRQAKRKREE
ncbi:hypothetical protein J7J26_03100 [Candidatus Micrarchaeota archaeon]|nr:hypothetical protein [Candidatus Micrarchaeota archaeon]